MEPPVYTPKGLPPIRLKNRPINPGLINALKEQIATWLKDGVIRPGGISPWNFPLLPIRKKNGKWRWVVDFRMLNSVTRKDSFPIPNIVELLSHLRKNQVLYISWSGSSLPFDSSSWNWQGKTFFLCSRQILPILSDAVWSNQCTKYMCKVSYQGYGRNS